jgi:ubiquinone/menaquinone biosynthesis C-methylase UbiE
MKQTSVLDKYAHEYDLMTNAIAREETHSREVAALINRFKPNSVLDAGCATGLTTWLFSRRGIATVGLDHSRDMLRVARGKFADTDYPMRFMYGAFEDLPHSLTGKFDLVVCLANAIVGTRSVGGLTKALRGFHRVLEPGGHLVIQMLNYSAMKEGEVRPIRVTERDGLYFLRYSIRRGNKLNMHVIRLDTRQTPPDFEPFVTEFENFDVATVTGALRKTGFAKLRKFGNLLLSKRFNRTARDLVLVASRPSGRS